MRLLSDIFLEVANTPLLPSKQPQCQMRLVKHNLIMSGKLVHCAMSYVIKSLFLSADRKLTILSDHKVHMGNYPVIDR